MKKALGILGGMGPQATIDMLQKVIDLTKANTDAEHLRIYVDNHPQIPDRIAAILADGTSPLPALQESLAKLEGCGAEVIAMPCVTAHYFLPAMQQVAKVQLLDMLELIVQTCQQRFAGQKVGLLSSVATAESGLMAKRLEQANIPYLIPQPADQQELGRLILQVKAKQTAQTVERFQQITAEMAERGADYFVLACTELPLIAQAYNFPYPALDVTEELARAAVLACGYELR
jgi:aspartate racemase